MNIVQTDAGALAIMLAALGSSPTMKLRLFSNNVTVSRTTVLSDLTEASFTGYAAVTPGWGTPVLVGGVATTTPSPTSSTFTYSGGSSTIVYGAYLTDSAGTVLLGATTFPSPVTLSTIVTQLLLYPVYQQTTQYTSS